MDALVDGLLLPLDFRLVAEIREEFALDVVQHRLPAGKAYLCVRDHVMIFVVTLLSLLRILLKFSPFFWKITKG